MTTYYVRPTNGSDGNAGTTFAAAFATTQKAADTATDGDEIRLCNEATESPSATIDWDTNAGTILVRAGDSTDGSLLTTGFYTISGASIGGGADVMDFDGTVVEKIIFDRVRVTGGGGVGLDLNGAISVGFRKGRIDSNAGKGVKGDQAGSKFYAIDTEVDGNGSDGIGQSTTTRLVVGLVGCSVHDNTGDGVDFGQDGSFDCCEIYDNGGNGILANGNLRISLTNSTFFANDGHNVHFDNASVLIMANNSFGSAGGYGVRFDDVSQYNPNTVVDYNHYYNNTSGAIFDGSAGVAEGDVNDDVFGTNNQTGDPQFTSTTDGSEDFTFASGSPLDGNGLLGKDIGARRVQTIAAVVPQSLHSIEVGIAA